MRAIASPSSGSDATKMASVIQNASCHPKVIESSRFMPTPFSCW